MRGTASARVFARLLTLCAVLAGLFFMHGLPAQACAGGTGGMPATVTTASPPVSHLDSIALAAGPVHRDMVASLGAVVEHGTPCDFAPAPRGIDVLLLLLLLAATVALASPRLPGGGGRRNPISHRAPPRTAGELLTALCVSRT